MRLMNERSIDIQDYPVDAATLGDLLSRVSKGDLDNGRARDVLAHMVDKGGSVDDAIKELGIESVDNSEIEQLCRELLAANPSVVQDYRDGKKQAVGSLIGQAKKKNPNAQPQMVRQTLVALIEQG